MTKPKLGLVGLGVMGRSLATNLARQGFPLAVASYSASEVEAFATDASTDHVPAFNHLPDLIETLGQPRCVFLMVTAGQAVDDVIAELAPLLSEGDTVIDGGNSHYLDTARRSGALATRGIRYLGVGVSGGEEGARNGASIMVGGDRTAFDDHQGVFNALSAPVDDSRSVTYAGPDGAGHFVKMVHNGIEYAMMQAIAESWHLMDAGFGWSRQQQADIFARWNRGRLHGFLIEITADILRKEDELASGYLLDAISDRAGQKGTGRWTVEAAMQLGLAIPSINTAVTERFLSAKKADRISLALDTDAAFDELNEDVLERALLASFVASFVQGFALVHAASEEARWNTDLSDLARAWRSGCIVRTKLLTSFQVSLADCRNPVLLLAEGEVSRTLAESEPALREMVTFAIKNRLPVPVMAASINWLDSLRTAKLPTHLIAAQRDFFGAHTYEREDRDGTFHTDWKKS